MIFFKIILQDVFGHITAIQPLEQKMVGNERLENKCEDCIENIKYKYSKSVYN